MNRRTINSILIFLLMIAILTSCDATPKIADGDFSYMEGIWYKEGTVGSASVEFFGDGAWRSVSSDGEPLSSGTYTISDGHKLIILNSDGEFDMIIVVWDKNTFTLGDSGTEYKRYTE